MIPTRRTGPDHGPGENHAEREAPPGIDTASRPSAQLSEALLPLVAAALDSNAGSALARLRQIAAHSSSRERYTPLELISDGPGGRVLRVWDEDLQREVALKEILLDTTHATGTTPRGDEDADTSETDERLARFIDEARITSQLDHPSIVGVHEIAADAAGRVYYTMPLVRGATLAQVIQRLHGGDTTWTLPRAISILVTVCDAVAYAHARGVVHQDLKPENVMVGSFGEAIVTDWGLARVLRTKGPQASTRVAGTPAYMAPEVSEQGGSILGDVYALGATLYCILTNRTPHEATVLSGHRRRPLSEVLAESPRSPLELAPDAPRELVAVAERAMSKDPEGRYQDAADLAADLRAWVEGRVVQAFESGPLAELRKWHRRNRGLAIALHSLAVLSLLGTGVVFKLQSDKGRAVAAKEVLVNRRSYVAGVLQADLDLRAGLVNEARSALADCDPELRGWEWDHLSLKSDASLLTMHPFETGSPGALLSLADGSLVLGSDRGDLVRLDGISLAARQRRNAAHDGPITALAEIPGSALFLSTSGTGPIKLWRADTLSSAGVVELGALRPLKLIALDAERAFFLVPEGDLYSLNLRTHAVGLLARGSSGGGSLTLAGSPVRLVACTGGGMLISLDPTDPESPPVTRDLQQGVRALVPLGPSSLLVGTWSSRLLVLDPNDLTGRQLDHNLSQRRMISLASSPNGDRICVGTAGGALVLLGYEQGTFLSSEVLLGHLRSTLACVLQSEAGAITSISSDGTLRRWDPKRASTRVLRIPSLRGSFDFSVSANRVVGAEGNGTPTNGWVRSLALDGMERSIRIEDQGHPPAVVLVSEGRTIAATGAPSQGSGTQVNFYDASTGTTKGHLPPRPVTALALDRDAHGKRLACRGADGRLRVWALEPSQLLMDLEGLGEENLLVRLSRDGRRVAIALDDRAVRVLDVQTAQLLAQASGSHLITALAFGADDQVLWIGDQGGRIRSLPIGTASEALLVHTERDRIQAMAVSPDGMRVAIATPTESTLRVRDAVSGDLMLTLPGHSAPPHALAFSPDGTVLASASPDTQLRLWYASH